MGKKLNATWYNDTPSYLDNFRTLMYDGGKAALYINQAAQLRAKELFQERTSKLQERFEQNNVQEV